MYKFVHISDELLSEGLLHLSSELSQVYRFLARQLHPDKNGHPQAKEAFQKVLSAMETVKARNPVQSSNTAARNGGRCAATNFDFFL